MSRRGAGATTRARVASALMAVLLGGCGDSGLEDLRQYVEDVKARPPKPLEPLPEFKPIPTFIYEPDDRRDPFVMDAKSAQAASVAAADGLAPDPLRRKEELEQYALDSLRMVGTLEQNDTRWGLVTTPDGILHRVRVGNYLGLNNGQITGVGPESIQLTEIVGDGPGRWRERQAAIALSQ